MTIKAGQLLVEEIVPGIAAVVARSVKLVGCEDVEEIVQDATAMAAKMLHNAEQVGKKVTAGNVAYYTIQHIKSGRRSVGYSSVDVLASATQLYGKCQVESTDVLIPADDQDTEGIPLGEIMSRDSEDPSTIAGREVDWEKFLAVAQEHPLKESPGATRSPPAAWRMRPPSHSPGRQPRCRGSSQRGARRFWRCATSLFKLGRVDGRVQNDFDILVKPVWARQAAEKAQRAAQGDWHDRHLGAQ